MYTYVAYHGTSRDAAYEIIETRNFRVSSGDATFLGTGAYFFEAGPRHALSWADRKGELEGCQVAVIEAVIHAEVVLNLCDRKHQSTIQSIYSHLSSLQELPAQIGPDGLFSDETRQLPDFGKNKRDHCVMNVVIEVVNETLKPDGQEIEVVRCPFVRGKQLYPQSWFFTGACVMLSVTKLSCISEMRIIE